MGIQPFHHHLCAGKRAVITVPNYVNNLWLVNGHPEYAGTVMIDTTYWNPSNEEQCGRYLQEVWKFEGKRKSRMTPENFQHHMNYSYSEQKMADDGDRILGKVDAVG
mmetsp:Transcript_15210/g.21153  ORF Transcript_15210/g.21153 Transcript_15210/m.21153 type:complete len:107 (+) Transcript_15210:113-433(+)